MANEAKGEVEFKVGSKRFKIRLNTNTVAEATPYMGGHTIFDIDVQDLRSVRALLFVMARGQNGISTIEDAGNLIDEEPLTVCKAVDEAVALFFRRWMLAQPAEAA